MKIWVDADACPRPVKEILFRAAERVRVAVVLVANMPLEHPRSPYVSMVRVPRGFDVADSHIVLEAAPGDLVVTADVPLAAAVVEKGAIALSPRGELFTTDTIKARLTMRNLMEEMRSAGVNTGGPPPFGPRDRNAFANALDVYLRDNIHD